MKEITKILADLQGLVVYLEIDRTMILKHDSKRQDVLDNGINSLRKSIDILGLIKKQFR